MTNNIAECDIIAQRHRKAAPQSRIAEPSCSSALQHGAASLPCRAAARLFTVAPHHNTTFLQSIVGKSRKVTIFASPKKTQTVKPLKEFHIPFLGLKVGTHHYQFNLTDAFFDAFEYSEITTANIDVEVQLEKQSTLLVLDFELSGSVELMCDRCGDAFQQPLQSKERLIVKFGDETSSTDEEILILGPSENTVDIEQYLYEYAHLALPARHVHETEEECNQEVLAAYKKYSVESDERDEWAALKNLHFEDNEPFEDDEEE